MGGTESSGRCTAWKQRGRRLKKGRPGLVLSPGLSFMYRRLYREGVDALQEDDSQLLVEIFIESPIVPGHPMKKRIIESHHVI